MFKRDHQNKGLSRIFLFSPLFMQTIMSKIPMLLWCERGDDRKAFSYCML